MPRRSVLQRGLGPTSAVDAMATGRGAVNSVSQAKPGSCWPALMLCWVLGSVSSARALPLIYMPIPPGYAEDCCKDQVRFKIGSGNLPFSFL